MLSDTISLKPHSLLNALHNKIVCIESKLIAQGYITNILRPPTEYPTKYINVNELR